MDIVIHVPYSEIYLAYKVSSTGDIEPLHNYTGGLVASEVLSCVRSCITKAKKQYTCRDTVSFLIYKVSKTGISDPVVELVETISGPASK